MKALVGLGNPGPEYELTRHNVGFLALEEAASLLGIAGERSRFKGIVMEGRLGDERVVLFKPATYMNLSGEALVELMHWYKLEPEDIFIMSDDIDLSPGMMRLRQKGGAGTHNGWRSIIQMAASQGFPRARIGIGAPPQHWDLKDWVLSRWDQDENAEGIREAIQLAAKAGVSFLKNGMQLTMNLYNIKSRPKKPAENENTIAPEDTDAV
ncbi:MAG: aminoacyl-tRNA hydrolase [Clostridiales bacterium]|nr:aminoacyl-tRNA hydrolase [Clostridiales bacterium]